MAKLGQNELNDIFLNKEKWLYGIFLKNLCWN